jgi:micrococcal nuclease
LIRLALACALLITATAASAQRCLAIDGDTLVCNRQKIRLVNVYAAELNQAGGAAAKRKLQALVQGRDVALKSHGHDRYGRVLAEAFVDGRRIEQHHIGPRAGRARKW